LNAFITVVEPCLKRAYELKRIVWLTDIAPIIAFPLGFPPLKDSEGAVLFEAFDEDFIRCIFQELPS